MLDTGADPNAKDRAGNAPLHWALDHDSKEWITKALLDAGADPNLKNKVGNSPLHFAARYGRTTAVEILLDAGADPNLKNKKGELPLDVARGKAKDVLFAYMLSKPGTQPNPVLLATAAQKGDLDAIAALLDAGADPNAEGNGGNTPLHAAIRRGHTAAIAALLDAGADPGEPLLHWVVRVPRIPTVIPVLVDRGADPNAKDGHGFTPCTGRPPPATQGSLPPCSPPVPTRTRRT